MVWLPGTGRLDRSPTSAGERPSRSSDPAARAHHPGEMLRGSPPPTSHGIASMQRLMQMTKKNGEVTPTSDQHSLLSTALATLASSSQLSETMSQYGELDADVVVVTASQHEQDNEATILCRESIASEASRRRKGSPGMLRSYTRKAASAEDQRMHGARQEDVLSACEHACYAQSHLQAAYEMAHPKARSPSRTSSRGSIRWLSQTSSRAGSRDSSRSEEDPSPVQESHALFTHAIGKAVEFLAEKRGLDYVAKTLVAELDALKAQEAEQSGGKYEDAPSSAAHELRPHSRPPVRQRPNSTAAARSSSFGARPREALRLGHMRKSGPSSQLPPEQVRKFKAFCDPTSQRLDARSFTKLCKDSLLFDRGFTAVDADIIFKQVLAGSGQRRMDLPQFELALKLAAEKKGTEAPWAEPARLSDEKVTRASLARHTGVHIG